LKPKGKRETFKSFGEFEIFLHPTSQDQLTDCQ